MTSDLSNRRSRRCGDICVEEPQSLNLITFNKLELARQSLLDGAFLRHYSSLLLMFVGLYSLYSGVQLYSGVEVTEDW